MTRDYIILLFIIGCTVLSTLIFIRKNNIRKAFLAVLTTQFFTWPIGLLTTSLGKNEYPVRLFPRAVDSSFMHGFILNPLVYAIYYTHYPAGAKLIWKQTYTILISAILPSIEILENKYTNLLKYKDWKWYYSWILAIIVYFINRKYLDWFFRNVPKQRMSRNED